MSTEVEHDFADHFIRKEKRLRFKECLASAKSRQKILKTLYHFSDFEERHMLSISSGEQNPESIFSILKGYGAPDQCQVISTNEDLDGKNLDLKFVIERIHGKGDGTIVICLPKKLGFFEGEHIKDRWILLRK